jgi:hypothetical protein
MQRYFDGTDWTMHHAPPVPAPQAPQPAGVIVTGPNHALHAILSLLTFPLCGGWIWIWLIVAFDNKKKVQPVDALGNPIPLTAQQIAARQEQRRQQLITVAVMAAILMVILILSAIVH